VQGAELEGGDGEISRRGDIYRKGRGSWREERAMHECPSRAGSHRYQNEKLVL
jgi:hypothetical protein